MDPCPTYFLYARKSTQGEDRQALSIQGQLDALERLIKEKNLRVVDRIIERQSAHSPGRPRFNEMMRRIEAGEAQGIIAWHPDRLSRNSRDGGEIIYFLDTGKLVDLKFATFWFENSPQGKSNLGHELVQTKQFSDKLACDTRRGLQEKARMGHYPASAPRGYLNDKATRTIVVDPVLGPVMREAFERYAGGITSLDDLIEFFLEKGVLSKRIKRSNSTGGKRIHIDLVRRILANPIYYGHFRYAGEVFEGRHQPLITKQLFDRVQAVRERRTRHHRKERVPKPFTQLLRCGECGMMVTAEIQKGHTYYRCSRKAKVGCSQPYVREEALDGQLSDMLGGFSLPAAWAEEMLRKLDAEERTQSQSSRTRLHEKQTALTAIAAKLQKLLDAYLEGLIDREAFTERKAALMDEKKGLQEEIKNLEDHRLPWLEPMRNWIQRAGNTGEIAKTGSLHEKKRLASDIFGSNLTLVGKKARGSALKPWSFLPISRDFLEVVPPVGIEPTF